MTARCPATTSGARCVRPEGHEHAHNAPDSGRTLVWFDDSCRVHMATRCTRRYRVEDTVVRCGLVETHMGLCCADTDTTIHPSTEPGVTRA